MNGCAVVELQFSLLIEDVGAPTLELSCDVVAARVVGGTVHRAWSEGTLLCHVGVGTVGVECGCDALITADVASLVVVSIATGGT